MYVYLENDKVTTDMPHQVEKLNSDEHVPSQKPNQLD